MNPSPKSITASQDPAGRDPSGITIEWSDGERRTYPFVLLRKACPCALCKGERTPLDQMGGIGGRAVSPPDSSESSGSASDERIDAFEVKEMFKIGRYAIGFKWGDGHETGIYTFDYLRGLST